MVMHTKFLASVMVLGVVNSKGDGMPPQIFIEGLRVNATAYTEVLDNVVKLWVTAIARGRPYVFQQDRNHPIQPKQHKNGWPIFFMIISLQTFGSVAPQILILWIITCGA